MEYPQERHVFSAEEAARCFGLFLPEGAVVEIRALGAERGGTVSGYFNDREAAMEAALAWSGRAEGVYVTVNPVDAELLARANNRMKTFARTTTVDDEVTRRRWLFVDIDSVRPRGVSATQGEHRASLQRAREVRAFLQGEGWADPVIASSGNGVHLLYRINTENTPEARDLCSNTLRVLAARFSDSVATVDASTFNAARICRLYGTQARKGDATQDRPHRVSRILQMPEPGAPLTCDDLREFVRRHGAGLNEITVGRRLETPIGGPLGSTATPRHRALDLTRLDIVAWFRHHDCYGHRADDDRGTHTVKCPWEDEHSAGDGAHDSDTVIWDGSDGRLPNFRCLHAHCTHKKLREVAAEWGDAEDFGARLRAGREYPLTDEGNAMRLADRFGASLRYAGELGGWLFWDGARWAHDGNDVEPINLMAQCIVEIDQEAQQVGEGERRREMVQWVRASQKWERTRSQVTRASKLRELQAKVDQFDGNPWLLNCLNGVVDLRTGDLHAPSPEHYSSLIAPHAFDVEAQCPRFDQFLNEVFAGDRDIIDFIWRGIGYSLTGSTREQVLFFCYGYGANGKSTFLETVMHVLGTYAGTSAPGLLLESKQERHPTEVADLRGRRFVACVEVGEGRRFAEETVKRLTGSDALKARFMRRDFFEFKPSHKLWLAANHKPIVRGTDEAIWRRLPMVPFVVTFRDEGDRRDGPRKDKALLEKLFKEAPGILAKAVRYAKQWHEDGLQPPAVVIEATREYREEQDLLGSFLDQECLLSSEAWDTSGNLYTAYRNWCEDSGEHVVSQRQFGLALTERGFVRAKVSTYRWRGLRALTDSEKLAREADAALGGGAAVPA